MNRTTARDQMVNRILLQIATCYGRVSLPELITRLQIGHEWNNFISALGFLISERRNSKSGPRVYIAGRDENYQLMLSTQPQPEITNGYRGKSAAEFPFTLPIIDPHVIISVLQTQSEKDLTIDRAISMLLNEFVDVSLLEPTEIVFQILAPALLRMILKKVEDLNAE